MDYSAEIDKAKKLLNEENYILCSVKCGMIVEDILKNSLNNLYNNTKGAPNKNAIYPYTGKLTLGKLIKVFKNPNVFRLLSDFYKINRKKINDIDFDTMLRIRNKAAHERREDSEDGADADAYIMYGYLLKFLNIFLPVLGVPQKVAAIKLSSVQKPQYSQKKLIITDFEPAKVIRRQKKKTVIPDSGINDKNNEPIKKETIEVCKNKRTGKFFIFLDKVSKNESHYIIPDGKIKTLSSDLFYEIEVRKKQFLLTNNLITPEQSEKLIFCENELNSSRIDHPILKRDSDREPGYIKKYRKMLESPNTIPSIMLRCIKSAGTIRWNDLKKVLIERYNYKESGSFTASLRVLEIDRYIEIDGQGDGKIISIQKI